MSAAVWISARIDELIKQIEKVTVFKNHWSLIGKNLRQLRHRMTEMTTKKLLPTVEIIERLTAYCCDDHSLSQKIAYRELESALFRLHLRLTQHLANLADDYQTKINILCDGYHEQQLLRQKSYNETIRQRLGKIDQSSARHTKTIEFYMRCCMELHKSISVIGLKSETIGKVAHGYYGLSAETRSELPLTRSFFELKT